MDLHRIASKVVEARKRKPRKKPVAQPAAPVRPRSRPEVLTPQTEFSCKVDLSLTADFEGDVAKKDLIKKVKAELVNSIKAGMTAVCKDLGMECTNVLVQPIQVECAVNDQASIEDDEGR